MAQASGKDVRDILDLPAQSQAGSSTSGPTPGASRPPPRPPQGPPTHHAGKHRSKSSSKKKADGITRELYALLGDNAPTLAVSQAGVRPRMEDEGEEGEDGGEGEGGMRPKFRKRKRREAKVGRWEWAPFRHPARQDGLVLRHWARKGQDSITADGATDEPPVASEYPFSVFDTNSGVYTYTAEEYSLYLRDDDWSKEETDYLIDLCTAYDLRFVVIFDRWDFPASAHKNRTMEDLKARYYAIARRLIRQRISAEDVESRQALLATYAFDKARESERKRMLARLFTRTPQQLAEEEALYVEARRLEQQEARFASDREDLLKLLGGWERVPNVAPSLVAEAGAGLALTGGAGASGTATPGTTADDAAADTGSSRRKKRRADDGGDAGAGTSAAPPALTAKQKAELKQAHFDETHCITRFDTDAPPLNRPLYPFLIGVASTSPPVPPTSHHGPSASSNASHGVFLRSARLLTPRQAQFNRAMQSLAELTPPIGPRLVFPTRSNCEKWEGLLGAVTSGLEMKKQTDRVESELRIAKSRLAGLTGGGGNAQSGTAAAPATAPVRGSTAASATPAPASAPAGTAGRGRSAAAARRSATPRTAAARTSRSRTPAAGLAAATETSAGTGTGTNTTASTPGGGAGGADAEGGGGGDGVEGEVEMKDGT